MNPYLLTIVITTFLALYVINGIRIARNSSADYYQRRLKVSRNFYYEFELWADQRTECPIAEFPTKYPKIDTKAQEDARRETLTHGREMVAFWPVMATAEYLTKNRDRIRHSQERLLMPDVTRKLDTKAKLREEIKIWTATAKDSNASTAAQLTAQNIVSMLEDTLEMITEK